MYILGISAFQSDSSAALLKDGRLIGAIEEEKIVEKKHTGDFPVNAIKFLLKKEDIDIRDVDHIAYFWNPFLGLHYRLGQIIKYLPGSLNFFNSHGSMWRDMVSINKRIQKEFGLNKQTYKFHNINHHLSHAASSYFLSDFKESAILTVDGSGEWKNTAIYSADGNNIRLIKDTTYPNSLGYVYASVTQYLGFRPNSGEGKVMGLSSYGNPEYIDIFRKIIKLCPEGEYKIDLSYFDYYRTAAYINNTKLWISNKFINQFGPMRVPESKIEKRHEDIAASLQYVLNETILHIVNYLYDVTKSDNLCIAGGVALNSVANGYVLKKSKFKNIFFQPAAGDGGGSVGAALYLHNSILDQSRVFSQEAVYLGPEFSREEILRELDNRGFPHSIVDSASAGAKIIAEGNILGWFQGRSEFGPRALGHRSILGDPRKKEMKDIMNLKVKHRESFRPFAPSILEEKLTEYFDYGHPSPVMLLVYDVLPDKADIIPSVIHVDGTGRVQTVSRENSPLYYDLINSFYKITNVPVVLNTSFNVRGKPIVCTPAQAIDCFLSTQMDYLIMNDVLVSKKDVLENEKK